MSRREAAYSFACRARVRAAASLPAITGPGDVIERMDVRIPFVVMAAWSDSGVHSGVGKPEGSPPAYSTANLISICSLNWIDEVKSWFYPFCRNQGRSGGGCQS